MFFRKFRVVESTESRTRHDTARYEVCMYGWVLCLYVGLDGMGWLETVRDGAAALESGVSFWGYVLCY